MLLLKSSDHFFRIGKDLFEEDRFSDILFITDTATFYSHSQLLVHHVQLLSTLICSQCRYGHQQIVVFLPGVQAEFMEIALMEFYLKGDSTKLNLIINANSAENNLSENVTSRNTEECSPASSISSNKECGENGENSFLENVNLENTLNDPLTHAIVYLNSDYNGENGSFERDAQINVKVEQEVQDGEENKNGRLTLPENDYSSNKSITEEEDDENYDYLENPVDEKNMAVEAVQFKINFTTSENGGLPNKIALNCNLNGCKKEFETSYGLRDHQRKQHGTDKDYHKHECPFCGKTVMFIDSHIKAVHKEFRGDKICDVCRDIVEGDMKKHRGVCIFCPFCKYKNQKKTRLLRHIASCKSALTNYGQIELPDLISVRMRLMKLRLNKLRGEGKGLTKSV